MAIAAHRRTRLIDRKYIVYLCALHHFLSLERVLSKLSPAEIQEKSRGIPSQVLNGLLANFAQKSGKRFSITDKMRTKILSWICALSLVLDGGVTDVGRTAKDLNMTDVKYVPLAYVLHVCLCRAARPGWHRCYRSATVLRSRMPRCEVHVWRQVDLG